MYAIICLISPQCRCRHSTNTVWRLTHIYQRRDISLSVPLVQYAGYVYKWFYLKYTWRCLCVEHRTDVTVTFKIHVMKFLQRPCGGDVRQRNTEPFTHTRRTEKTVLIRNWHVTDKSELTLKVTSIRVISTQLWHKFLDSFLCKTWIIARTGK
jgi:hypothetical protein